MDKSITPEEFITYGVQFNGDKMKNGELRFRLISLTSNSSYIRTESSEPVGWQKSHYHTKQTEYYLVERGKVLFASIIAGNVHLEEFTKGSSFRVEPSVPHNMLLSRKAIVHCLKIGGESDWNGFADLDLYLSKVSFENYL